MPVIVHVCITFDSVGLLNSDLHGVAYETAHYSGSLVYIGLFVNMR